MPVSGQRFELQDAIFEQLKVDRRIIVVPGRVIPIRSIASVSVGQVRFSGAAGNRQLALILVLAVVFFFIQSIPTGFAVSSANVAYLMASAGTALTAAVIFISSFMKADSQSYLVISTSDGSKVRFTGRLEIMEQGKDLLTATIQADDEAATFNINFANGDIQVLNAGSINTDAIIQGKDHKTDIKKNIATGDGSRAGTADTTTNTMHATTVTNSQGVQVGTGHEAFGNTTTVHQPITYGEHIDTLEKWRDYFAQHDEAGTRALRDRIERLEQLLRTGTPEPTQRSTVLKMASELSQVVQGYPAFLHLMQAIVRSAGF